MDEKPDTISDLDRLRNLPIRSEEIGFSPEEMIACAKCAKPNAPNRSACLYCGAEFHGVARSKLDSRELESWENGFNVVITAAAAANVNLDAAAEKLAALLTVDAEMVSPILRSGKALPIARVESKEQAALISEMLAGIGIESRTVQDESLLPSALPHRLRSIEFADGKLALQLFNGVDIHSLGHGDLALIVTGVIQETQTESLEKRKRRVTTTVSEAQTSSDEPVIDIYSKHDSTGWRIPTRGFDFSCLGPDKSLLVAENMEKLVLRLAGLSGWVKVIDDFGSVGSMLEHCWPSESRKDNRGLKRSGLAQKYSSVFTTTNALQLTKYSRLQWHLL